MTRIAACLIIGALLTGCVTVPDGITPVRPFDAERYLGTWYEIARQDHSFERGLSHVTATYGRREDGGISVRNEGFDTRKDRWDAAEGKAYFVEDAQTGYLKVSFFGPFYGAYIVFDLDPDYRWSLITGPNRDYLWILARTPEIDDDLKARMLTRIRAAGFDPDDLVFVEQGNPPPGRGSAPG
ncbi:MAG: lipocalin family protein [Pseudomonadales bacterium]|jgi:apolipoprotein D and lipocalin family protein|nr:lipocalin family protein [Pseudomonadales bacterium]